MAAEAAHNRGEFDLFGTSWTDFCSWSRARDRWLGLIAALPFGSSGEFRISQVCTAIPAVDQARPRSRPAVWADSLIVSSQARNRFVGMIDQRVALALLATVRRPLPDLSS